MTGTPLPFSENRAAIANSTVVCWRQPLFPEDLPPRQSIDRPNPHKDGLRLGALAFARGLGSAVIHAAYASANTLPHAVGAKGISVYIADPDKTPTLRRAVRIGLDQGILEIDGQLEAIIRKGGDHSALANAGVFVPPDSHTSGLWVPPGYEERLRDEVPRIIQTLYLTTTEAANRGL